MMGSTGRALALATILIGAAGEVGAQSCTRQPTTQNGVTGYEYTYSNTSSTSTTTVQASYFKPNGGSVANGTASDVTNNSVTFMEWWPADDPSQSFGSIKGEEYMSAHGGGHGYYPVMYEENENGSMSPVLDSDGAWAEKTINRAHSYCEGVY